MEIELKDSKVYSDLSTTFRVQPRCRANAGREHCDFLLIQRESVGIAIAKCRRRPWVRHQKSSEAIRPVSGGRRLPGPDKDAGNG